MIKVEVSFFCKKCSLDQNLLAFINFNGYGNWFQAKCGKCNCKLIRYITEKEKDPYYRLSKNVIINRDKYKKDLIQPNDYGFKTYYKEQYDKMEKAEEEYQKKIIKEKIERDKFYKKFKHNINEKQIVKKAIELEEKLCLK